ncbi:MAG: FdhF/YdeP family oxidoreductase [Cyclobacteriaceae bacterium]|nr:FdhF/YdeP family oxidoreductase [Cyclobacteriaceae bacterium]MDW8330518.1 FdhF/YdeP family oxidoreductase [Cyclobacteriaceae bacterium]
MGRKNKVSLKISSPKSEAGGLAAVLSAAEHIFTEAGIVEGTRTLLKVNQFDGYDCPGCAWPDPDEGRSVVEFCENGAKAVAEEATTARCDEAFFARHSVEEMRLWDDYEIGKSGRITRPFIRREGATHYEPVEWSEAFSYIGKKLRSLAPGEAVFYTSGRTSNEAAFLYQLFVRMYGTNNLPDCSNMCHESSGVALSETLGIGKGSVKLDDFYCTELIIIMGQNPGSNHPRMLSALQQAKKNGAKIITINPLPEAGLIAFRHPQHPADLIGKATTITDLWLPVKVNEDVSLLKAILKILLQKEEQNPGTVIDKEFINTHTTGYDKLVKDLSRYDLHSLIARSGVTPEKVYEAAEWIAQKKKIIVCWAMGLTQHKNAVDNIREIVNLLLLKGSIGKPGAGTCPVRGHSNVQGDRTMGIWENPKPEFLDSLKRVFGFEPPRKPGYNTVETIKAMAEGKVKVFFAMGGNFLSATPDTDFTSKAMEKCDLTVHVSTKLNRSHLHTGKTGIILPCLGRTETDVQASGVQFVTVENSTGVVHKSQGGKTPASPHLLSEPKIIAELAKATLTDSSIDWDGLVSNYDNIRNLIEQTIPGFENYNERVRKPGGFYLPNAAREGKFRTTDSLAHFTLNALPDYHVADDEFLLMTIRSHDQYNTTIYGMHDRYRGIYNGRNVVFVNTDDMKKHGLQQGDRVDLVSRYDGIERRARGFVVVPYQIPRQNIAAYFPEANAVVPHNHAARGSHTPISKSVVVRLEKNA